MCQSADDSIALNHRASIGRHVKGSEKTAACSHSESSLSTEHSSIDLPSNSLDLVQIGVANKEPSWSMDNLGILASTVCMVHCISMPLLISALPFVGAGFLESDFTHEILAAFVLVFAIASLLPGYIKHKDPAILGGLIAGLSLVMYATFFVEHALGPKWEMPLISVGNIIIVLTHLRNRKHVNCKH